jgi:hypothetical protein
MERSRILPVVFEEEFQVREGEFEYACNISPKTIGVRNIRISERKHLKPNIIPGEFEDSDQE